MLRTVTVGDTLFPTLAVQIQAAPQEQLCVLVRNLHTRSGPERFRNCATKLELSQTVFAELLRVSAMAVSRWERGINEPPGEAYIVLGKLAGSPDCWYFWERTGLKKSDLKRALRRNTS